jgi:hypothetical protein
MEKWGMLSRARISAAVTLLVSCLAGPATWAQVQNLEAGKSPSQLFAGTCTACHKSPRGLLKTVSAGALPGFLREHYTTSGDMASQLASFLISNGASDNRQAKQGADTKPVAGADQSDRQSRKPRNAPSQEAARPDADGLPQAETGRQGRKRLTRPGEVPEEAKPVSADGPAQAGIERGPDGRRLTPKQRLGKQGKPGAEEAPATARDEPPKASPSDQAKDQKGETGNAETAVTGPGKPDAEAKSNETKSSDAKPSEAKPDEMKPDAARIEQPKDGGGERPVARRDPVPPVTPAPTAAAMTPPAAASGAPDAPARQTPAEAPGVTASAPPPPASAGPPAPPISQ